MNIIRKYLDYRRNRQEVRHYEKVVEPREEDILCIGSPSLEDLARNYSLDVKLDVNQAPKRTPQDVVRLQEKLGDVSGCLDTLTPQDYKGEDQEIIKFWEKVKI